MSTQGNSGADGASRPEPGTPAQPTRAPEAAGAHPGSQKAQDSQDTQDTRATLRHGAIGTGDLVFFVVAAAAPLTVMSGVAPLAIGMAGPAAPLGYLIAGLLLLVFAAGFTAMSRHVRNAGAFYAYIGRGLGRPAGTGAAYLAVFAYNAIEVGLLVAFGWFTESGLVEVAGVRVSWWVWALAGLVAIGLLGYRQVTLSAKVLGVALVLEVLVLLVFEGGVFAHGGGPQGLDLTALSPTHLAQPGVGGMFVLAIGAFIGFEATAIYAEEARTPERSVPRATCIAVGFLALFYTFTVWTVLVAYGPDRAQQAANATGGDAMVFTATERLVGTWASDTMHVLLITSAFAATLAFHNGAARYFYALGRERLLPRRLGTVTTRTGSPAAAVLLQSLLALAVLLVTLISGSDPYTVTFLWTNGAGILGVMVLQALTALAVYGFFRRDRRGVPAWRVRAAPLVAGAGLGVLIVLVCVNFKLLTGADVGVNTALLAPLPVLFVAGVLTALRIRRRDPAAYQRLTTVGTEHVE